MIKKFGCGKILDKVCWMPVAFSVFFRKISDIFLIKFDPTIKFDAKIKLQ
jgi:hypothetical protein